MGLLLKLIDLGLDMTDMHRSEIEMQAITSYDHLIENNRSVNDLYGVLDQLVDKLV